MLCYVKWVPVTTA